MEGKIPKSSHGKKNTEEYTWKEKYGGVHMLGKVPRITYKEMRMMSNILPWYFNSVFCWGLEFSWVPPNKYKPELLSLSCSKGEKPWMH